MAKILVADDEPGLLDLLHTVLRRKGHDVVLAPLAQKAVELFRRERPQVTILDLNMPDMDGVSALRKIRAIDAEAPVIILTGAGTETAEQQARQLGVTDFLQKGFSLHRLGEALARALGQEQQPAKVGGQRA
jgi:DNA-binding NtrC family response regulator